MAVVDRIRVLELSPQAYDEIERMLLDAGYDFVFQDGPGSPIDLVAAEIFTIRRRTER